MGNFIPYGKQWLDKEDIDSVIEVLHSDFLTQGPKIKEFEEKICDYTGAQYCIAVSNGTAALHLAVKALNIEGGMEGITSPISFVATSNSLLYNNLQPVFADIDQKTINIDPSQIPKNITEKTKLLIPVHFAGQPCDMAQIHNIAERNNTVIIEDGSHAIGSRYADGSAVGNCKYSAMTTFSFHPVKTLTSAEGGAITTNDRSLYRKLDLLRTHGITRSSQDLTKESPGPWYYEMQELGLNYRLSDLHAAIGISQLKKLNRFIERRREIVKKYNSSFKKLPWLTIPFEQKEVFSAFHLYAVLIDYNTIGKTRSFVMNALRKNGVGTQVHYIPIYQQPYYQKLFQYRQGDFPIAEEYYQKALSLPLYPKMSDEDVEQVIIAVKEVA